MNIMTYRLELRPDPEIPQFARLWWEKVETPLRDVFRQGIHPHSIVVRSQGRDHTGAASVILDRMNEESAFVTDLKAHSLGCEITCSNHGHYGYGATTDDLERLFQEVSRNVYFVQEITYEQLVEVAIARLRRVWDHKMARDMVQALGRDFAGMRDFLRRKKADIRLVGYHSLDDYDLSAILSVDDFLTEDTLLVNYGTESHNYRRASVLDRFVVPGGRISLTPRIDDCVVDWDFKPGNWEPYVSYRCRIEGSRVEWRPDLKPDDKQRAKAREIAAETGRGEASYVFDTSVTEMTDALQQERFRLRFPDLTYREKPKPAAAKAKVQPAELICFGEASGLRSRLSNEKLKDVLRAFDKKLTGKKEDLVRRMAETIAEEYEAHEPQLDRFFRKHRFIRLAAQPKMLNRFPILEGHRLRAPILILYCLRHLRGNVILEAGHVNDSVKVSDLAEARLDRKVMLNGSFVPVV